ncbi:hypothetical protein SAMN04487912_110101 [Arthrobacter sp. cf158]|uniref:hypothetical protein n=1 Tax=Arthrobacter sp. cf158 TaxID=1761744 RepID=UPI000894DE18|nr:hypothetical protein [Arthrobacter sp. cf158]SDX32630.1 hypothetical protein SAMN04487912_110101 [Arthrobacter sp. cf158]
MKDHVHEHIGFREIDQHGNAVQAISPHVPEPPEADPARRRPSVNPFIVALWVLDAGLAWFGLCAFTTAAATIMSPGSAEAAQVNYMLLSNAPYALLAAALITGGLLFWHAMQWQKKRLPPTNDR